MLASKSSQEGQRGCAFVRYATPQACPSHGSGFFSQRISASPSCPQSCADAIEALHGKYAMKAGELPLVVRFADPPKSQRVQSGVGPPTRSNWCGLARPLKAARAAVHRSAIRMLGTRVFRLFRARQVHHTGLYDSARSSWSGAPPLWAGGTGSPPGWPMTWGSGAMAGCAPWVMSTGMQVQLRHMPPSHGLLDCATVRDVFCLFSYAGVWDDPRRRRVAGSGGGG